MSAFEEAVGLARRFGGRMSGTSIEEVILVGLHVHGHSILVIVQ
jgi:hypothetical protein